MPTGVGTATTSYTANSIIPIDPFNVTNAFLNYTVRNGSRLDQTKLRLSFNNLFDTRQIVGITQGGKGAVFAPSPNDSLTLLPGRSIMLSVTFGYAPGR